VASGRFAGKDESGKPILQVNQKIDEPEKQPKAPQALDQAAKATGTNRQYVADAKKIQKEKPELYEQIKDGKKTIPQAKKEIKTGTLEEKKEILIQQTNADIKDNRPIIYHKSCLDLLSTISDKSQDLLITDPPYSTDIDDIEQFVDEWLFAALDKVSDTGRAYICIGAYPKELMVYLNKLSQQDRFIVDNPLIWTYRNTLGVTPKRKYNLNYQVILHLYTEQSADLDTSITNEMFSVQDINAPDGRQGDRYHTWQKPDELAMRLIRHSTVIGAKVFDPFCCTGTFPIAAAKLNRIAIGCDISKENLLIAEKRGCNVV